MLPGVRSRAHEFIVMQIDFIVMQIEKLLSLSDAMEGIAPKPFLSSKYSTSMWSDPDNFFFP